MSNLANLFLLYLCKYTILLYSLDKYWFEYYYMYMFKYLLRRQSVIHLTVYCKSHRRQPIRLGVPPLFRDVQGDLPLAWCCLCGGEIFDRGQQRCIRCRNAKGAKENG